MLMKTRPINTTGTLVQQHSFNFMEIQQKHNNRNYCLLRNNDFLTNKFRNNGAILTTSIPILFSFHSSANSNTMGKRYFSSFKEKKKLEIKNSTIGGRFKSAVSWLIMILRETEAEANRRRDGEFLARNEDPTFSDTLDSAEFEAFKKDPASFKKVYKQKLKQSINLESRYKSMEGDLAMNENFLKSKMSSEQLSA